MDPSLAVSPRFLNETGKKKASLMCPFPGCLKAFVRTQDITRHIYGMHLPDCFYCSRAGCDWTGKRIYALRDHLTREHSGAELPESRQQFTIYDALRLGRQLLDKEITVERADFLAQSLFKNWALQRTLMISVG